MNLPERRDGMQRAARKEFASSIAFKDSENSTATGSDAPLDPHTIDPARFSRLTSSNTSHEPSHSSKLMLGAGDGTRLGPAQLGYLVFMNGRFAPEVVDREHARGES